MEKWQTVEKVTKDAAEQQFTMMIPRLASVFLLLKCTATPGHDY